MSTRYVHTNIIANDWQALAEFYVRVFDCVPVYPERDLSGEWLEEITKIPGCRIKGIHLALPGSEGEPTLEIFSYQPEAARTDPEKHLNSFGLGHTAFHVDDVAAVLKKLVEHGGTQHGALIHREYPGLGDLTAVYARDPEGNFIEIQHWDKPGE